MDLICLGNLVLDRVYSVPQLMHGSSKISSRSMRVRGGGAAAVAALAAAKLGVKTAFWGRVGDDPDGHWLTERMAQGGVDVSGVKALNLAQTPSASVMVDPAGERQIIVFNDPALELTPDWLPLHTGHADTVMLTDLRWHGAVLPFLEAAGKAKRRVVLDIDVVFPGLPIDDILRSAHYVICSEQGLTQLEPHEPDQVRALQQLGPRCAGPVAVTRGSQGSLWLIDGELLEIPAYPVEVKDSTGAGDVFHGVFAAGLASGLTLPEAARRASAASAMLCQRGLGWDGVPTAADIDDFLKSR